ncbi:MAG: chemotaxis protein CheY [Pseudobdellovibrio sp.]|jgi:CheY-like chemotaxis protein|nr:chemotaxis protein CheY [Pseudobdellovibrio sp.]
MAAQKILVAEDSPVDSVIIQRVLTSKGYDVTMTKNGEEAYKKFTEDKFDLLITDFFMPGLNGYELLGRLKENGFSYKAIVMTASKEDEFHLRSLNFGAFDHLQKPLNLHLFLAKVEQALRTQF